MNTEHLQYLLAIAQHQSINQAAEALHLQRSYLSKVVNNLERQWSVTFFERVPKGVVPTAEGQYALDEIAAGMGILTRLEQHFAPKQEEEQYPNYHDHLVLYHPAKMRYRNQLITVVEQFQQQFPNVSLALAEKHFVVLEETLQGRKDQLALVIHSDDITYLNWTLPENLQFIPIAELPVVALVANNHLLADSYQTISLANLCKQQIILMDAGMEQPLFYDLLAVHGKPDVKHVISGNMPLFYQLLRSGRYFSLGIYGTDLGDGLQQIPLRENIMVTLGILFDTAVLENFPAKTLLDDILRQLKVAEVQGQGGTKQ